MIKLGRNKTLTLVIVTIIFSAVVLPLSLTDDLQITRSQLLRFYETRFDGCVINKIVTRRYPGGRGDYELFYTDCDNVAYPILFDQNKFVRLTVNSKIFKEANSVKFKLLADHITYGEMRHPEAEDSRGFKMRIVIVIYLAVFSLLLFLPNSNFQKKP